MKLNFIKSKKLTPITKSAIIIMVALLVLLAIYFACDRAGYIKAFQLGLQLQQQEQQQDQDKIVLESLKKIILLPGDDVQPTMATINDVDALKAEQPGFFGNAKNGDRVIVYPELAIIYDYEANKIIKVGPVQIEQPQEGEAIEALDEGRTETSQ
jgi:hypothetical protein